MTLEGKGVFIQKKSIIVSLKALVLLKCLNTFVHDCRLRQMTMTCGEKQIFCVAGPMAMMTLGDQNMSE